MVDVRCLHLDAPVVNISFLRCHQPHITVDARARIPAAVFLLRIIHAHHYLILSCFYIRCSIHPERRVAIGPSTCLLSIHIHLGIHVHPLEVESHLLALVPLVERQHTSVPSLARGQVATVVARWRLFVKTVQDAPVVRQRHRLRLCKVTVVFHKHPPSVEQLFPLNS